jgi:hypothetical protein
MENLSPEEKGTNKELYWKKEEGGEILKGRKGEFISFQQSGLTVSRKQEALCKEVLEMLNRRYKRLEKNGKI